LVWNWAKTYLPVEMVRRELDGWRLATEGRARAEKGQGRELDSRFKGEADNGLDGDRGEEEPRPFCRDEVHLAAAEAVGVGGSDALAVVVAAVVLGLGARLRVLRLLLMHVVMLGLGLILRLVLVELRREARVSGQERPPRVLTVRQVGRSCATPRPRRESISVVDTNLLVTDQAIAGGAVLGRGWLSKTSASFARDGGLYEGSKGPVVGGPVGRDNQTRTMVSVGPPKRPGTRQGARASRGIVETAGRRLQVRRDK